MFGKASGEPPIPTFFPTPPILHKGPCGLEPHPVPQSMTLYPIELNAVPSADGERPWLGAMSDAQCFPLYGSYAYAYAYAAAEGGSRVGGWPWKKEEVST